MKFEIETKNYEMKDKKKFKFSWKLVERVFEIIMILGVVSIYLNPSTDIFIIRFKAGVLVFSALISGLITFKLWRDKKKK